MDLCINTKKHNRENMFYTVQLKSKQNIISIADLSSQLKHLWICWQFIYYYSKHECVLEVTGLQLFSFGVFTTDPSNVMTLISMAFKKIFYIDVYLL